MAGQYLNRDFIFIFIFIFIIFIFLCLLLDLDYSIDCGAGIFFFSFSFFFFSGIFHFALEGNALKAIELTEQLANDLLEKNRDLHFDLLSLHFVKLVCSRKWCVK